jgi:hypothetical protein
LPWEILVDEDMIGSAMRAIGKDMILRLGQGKGE